MEKEGPASTCPRKFRRLNVIKNLLMRGAAGPTGLTVWVAVAVVPLIPASAGRRRGTARQHIGGFGLGIRGSADRPPPDSADLQHPPFPAPPPPRPLPPRAPSHHHTPPRLHTHHPHTTHHR